MSLERVSIVGGTGALGAGLATRLAAAGHPVTIGSRDGDRAAQAAEAIGQRLPSADVSGVSNEEAATVAGVVFLTVPFAAQAATLAVIAGRLVADQVLVDTTVPLAVAVGGKPTRLLGVPQGSAAQQAQELVPDGVQVVAALHTVSADSLADLDVELDEDVLIAGRRKADKARVAAIVGSVPGLRPVNAGALEAAALIEGLTPLLISVNIRNHSHAGIKLTGLPGELW